MAGAPNQMDHPQPILYVSRSLASDDFAIESGLLLTEEHRDKGRVDRPNGVFQKGLSDA